MPKLGMEPKRRADVINATLTCISIYGIDGMTLDKVAEYADCSKGVVTYYFKKKDRLTIEAFKAFLSYFGLKIQSVINKTMTAADMIEVTLTHLLPAYRDDSEKKLNVSDLDGIEKMYIPYQDQARLFVQFFSKSALDPALQEVVSRSYQDDLEGIAMIFEYGNSTGQMVIENSRNAAYELLAMVVGLSFFRVADIPPVGGEDNRRICENYIKRLTLK